MTDEQSQERGPASQRLFGVSVGVVRDNQDPSQSGRVLVSSAAGGAPARDLWARVAVPRAGAANGTWLIPNVGDEVLLAFESGDARRPYVVGSLWSSGAAPPEQMAPGNPVMTIASAGGSRVTVEDGPGQLRIRLVTAGGRSLTLADAPGTITIDDDLGGTITMTSAGIEIRSAAAVRVTAATAEISAAAVRVDAGVTKVSGLLQCDTLLANSVVASNYSPGAGNVM